MVKNQMPKRFVSNIQERPDYLTEHGRGIHTEKYDDLAETLKLIEATKAVVMDVKEIEVLFGKFWRTSIKTGLKKRGIGKPRLAIKDGSVHIWATKV